MGAFGQSTQIYPAGRFRRAPREPGGKAHRLTVNDRDIDASEARDMIRVVVEAVMVVSSRDAASRGSTPARHGWLVFRHPDPAARAAAEAAASTLAEPCSAVQQSFVRSVRPAGAGRRLTSTRQRAHPLGAADRTFATQHPRTSASNFLER
jgi:hypothetical protein